MKAAYRTFFLALLATAVFAGAKAQSALEVFGKNRIQYKNLNWKFISTNSFEVYYYQGGNELAYFAARHAEADFDRIADLLGYTPYAKTKIFVYNSVADLQQSNVGLNNDIVLIGGQTNFVKSRVEIPYTGSVVDFKRELSLGIARMFITEMMFGGSLKDMVQSSYLLSLPEWFVSGAAAYVAEGWGAEMDDFARDMIVNKNVRKPSTLSGEEATLVGQSIWNYIAERYGKSNVSNILNLTRIIRNEESSIASTLGVYPYSTFLKEWRNFYATMNAPVLGNYNMPAEDVRIRRNNRNRFIYHQVKVSPNGEWIAYSENHRGRYRVFALNLRNGDRKALMSGGYRTIGQRFDEQVPLIGWRNKNQLVVVHVLQGEYAASVYDLTRPFYRRLASRKSLKSFIQVKDFDVSADGKTLVMSAVRNGRNDIFLYEISRGAVSQVTDDGYDDLHPHFTDESGRAFVFSSNRLDDSLRVDRNTTQAVADNLDLFSYEPTGGLKRLVATVGNETLPTVRGENIYFVNDLTGIGQLYRYNIPDRSVRQVTAFRQTLRSYDVSPIDSGLAYSILNDQREFVGYSRNFDLTSAKAVIQTRRSELLINKADLSKATTSGDGTGVAASETEKVAAAPKDQLRLEPGEVDTDNYEFDSDNKKVVQEQQQAQSITAVKENNRKQSLQINGPFAYQRRATVDNAVTSFIIDPIRGLGVTFDVTMNEMLEDHKLKGGLAGFFDLASSNFYGEYQYLKRRVEFGARYDKKTIVFNRQFQSGFIQRYNLHRIQFPVAYPFNIATRLSIAPTLLYTRYVETSGDAVTVANNPGNPPVPIRTTGYGGFRAEFVFDNTTVNGLNMTEGTRLRIRYERFQGLFNRDSVISPGGGESFNNFSIDARHYQKIHRDLILAVRLAYGRFAGRAPKQYLLGGMDNWAFNQRDSRPENDPLALRQRFDNRDLLFNEFATNMRGFPFNKLSGNSFVLLNAELRLPLVRYFYRGPITSNFFKNLQFVGFTDVGTAWTGASPFSRQNSLNTTVRDNGTFRAQVTNFKNPFLIGYGAGARTLLFGYYFKFDVAWGVEDFTVTPRPTYYLTLGYDF
ncbi:MAG: hypothetical protein MUD08_02195 [Cytophagales bacterium]|jgi:hypothetical protein|nr:hypothetical protein [Cytophagales bacterium]